MKISIIGFTDNGMEIAYKLSNSLSEDNKPPVYGPVPAILPDGVPVPDGTPCPHDRTGIPGCSHGTFPA